VTRRAPALAALALALAAAPEAGSQQVTTFAGKDASGPGGAATIYRPTAIAVDPSGNVYVADQGSLKIRKISPVGVVTDFAGTGDASYAANDFYGPLSVSVDGAGNVYAVDSGDLVDGFGWIKRITPSGVAENLVWDILEPVAVAVSGTNVYVADFTRGLLRREPDGRIVSAAPQLRGWCSLAVDAAGVVYVGVSRTQEIWKVPPGGVPTFLAGSGHAGYENGIGRDASFRQPNGLTVDSRGDIYVADWGNNVIRKVTKDGVVTTLAGSGAPGNADGVGSSASFRGPNGVALDGAGNLYVADTENHAIRRISVADGAAANLWVVASAARVSGAGGAAWTTTLTLHNRASAPMTATLTFLGNGDDTRGRTSATIALATFQSITSAEAIATVFGIGGGFGAIEVLASSDALVVRSRTSTSREGGSVGDGIPGIPRSAFFTDRTTPSPVLAGLVDDEEFRTNLILVSESADPITIVVTASDDSGARLGETSYTVPPRGMIQDSRFLMRPELGGVSRSDVTVTLSSSTPGAAFTALASVIDNASNDPTIVLPQ
jgi:sugar lactone lactonase YvrE